MIPWLCSRQAAAVALGHVAKHGCRLAADLHRGTARPHDLGRATGHPGGGPGAHDRVSDACGGLAHHTPPWFQRFLPSAMRRPNARNLPCFSAALTDLSLAAADRIVPATAAANAGSGGGTTG